MLVDIVDLDVVKLTTKDYKQIEAVLPVVVDEVSADAADVYVSWDYHTMAVLAAMKQPYLATMMRDYSYPALFGEHHPMPHQRDIAEFLSMQGKAYCFGGMGVGKTASTVWAIDYLITIGQVKKVLIICTKSTMAPAWGNTIIGIAPRHSYSLLRGDSKTRKARAKAKSTIHIINHDGMGVCMAELVANNYDMIVVDESTAFKTAGINRWDYANLLCKKATRVWALSGAPTPKSPEDAYGQVKLVTPTRAPRSKTAWRDMVMTQISLYKWAPRHNAKELVHAAMQPAIYVSKAEVLKSQPKTFIVYREAELSPEQERMLKQLKAKEILRTKEGGTIIPVHAAAALTKYMQILLGAVYDDDGNATEVDASDRVKVVVDLIEAGRAGGVGEWGAPLGKSIVAVPYKHVLHKYEHYLVKAGYKVGIICGDVGHTARDKIINQFQTTHDIDVLLVVPDSIAHGLTLTAANTFIWCSPMTKPEIFQQANERMDRPGQKQVMTQARIYATKIEMQYYKVMEDRESWQAGMLALYKDLFIG